MKRFVKITRSLWDSAVEDLRRPHVFAYERVGFFACRFALTASADLLVLAHAFYPVADEDYIDDERFGALISSAAFRKAMQIAYNQNVGLFHVHMHDHAGVPKPSGIDIRETAKFVPDFFNVRPAVPHGAFILSADSMSGRIWLAQNDKPHVIDGYSVVGAPLKLVSSP